ncbi:hypothetical protein E2P61_04910 [Candidatus Bathyarchaeota archaeon]|nr:hypothetical protein E2P61_04910 [Candidatus Bathyarchaeota archaeon]
MIQEKSRLKEKAVTFTLLIVLLVSFLFMPLSVVTGQLGVSILLVNPEEEGVVGDTVNLQGTIDTTNGRYQIWFDEILVITSNSEGYYVNSNFSIPSLPEGDHLITLRDVTRNVNDTYEFKLKLAYFIKAVIPASPTQLQEGEDVVLNVTIAGVQSSTTHYANVTVELPKPLGTAYSRTVQLVAQSGETVATALVTYPADAFQPEGALSNYAGSYKAYFNKTQSLAETEFFVGFTDSSYYHRGQTVKTRAIGYQPGENATISIKYATGTSVYSEMATASSEGVFESSWSIPSDALIGDYNITITPDITDKLISDSQLFKVPGYSVIVQTFNLAGEVVSQIVVEALDQATNAIYNSTSDNAGRASLKLETGNHILSAYWNGVKVGELNVSIAGATSFDLTSKLTNLEITVKNEHESLMPFVTLDISYQYVTSRGNTLKTGFASGETDLSGTFILNSVLPEISYTINASLYDIIFNADNKTVTSVPLQSKFEVVILCPSRTLILNINDYNRAAIPNARIELVEVTNGLFNGATTDTQGTVTVEVTFGKYRLRVYNDEILLNSTVIDVFNDSQLEIHCTLFNIQLSVKVVDYFDQPIPAMSVVLHRSGIEPWSSTTQADGVATFSNVIGGDMQIIAYPEGSENSYEAANILIEESKEVEIKLSKYILIGPFLIESSALLTFIVILITILLFMSIEFYRRKQSRTADSES